MSAGRTTNSFMRTWKDNKRPFWVWVVAATPLLGTAILFPIFIVSQIAKERALNQGEIDAQESFRRTDYWGLPLLASCGTGLIFLQIGNLLWGS